MAARTRPDLTETLPDRAAAISAIAVGLAWVVLPTGWLEDTIDASGVAVLLPLAAPPLSMIARIVLALGTGALTAIVVWAGLYILFGAGGVFASTARVDGRPTVRRADAHPDAPPRRPLSIAELGPVIGLGDDRDRVTAAPVERNIPIDLDTPLSALDPGAIPVVPREPVRPVLPLASGERMQTFSLAPPPPARSEGAGVGSIEALLRRLGGDMRGATQK